MFQNRLYSTNNIIMKIIKHIVLLLGALLISGSAREIFSQDVVSVDLSLEHEIKLCGYNYEKEITLEFNIGEVAESDSLMGFSMWLKYDKTKIKYINVIDINTLFDNSELNTASVWGDTLDIQYIGKYDTEFNVKPVSGNKPLVVAVFEFIGDCEDTINFEILDFEPLEGYTRDYNGSGTFSFPVTIKENPDNYLNLVIDTDTLDFNDKDTLKDFNVFIELNEEYEDQITSIEFDLLFDDIRNYEFDDIVTEQIVSSITTEELNNGLHIATSIEEDNSLNKENLLFIRLREICKTNSEQLLTIENVKINNCTCYSELNGSSTLIKSIEPNNVVIDEDIIKYNNNITSYYDYKQENWVIENNDDFTDIKSIEIYDMNGRMIKYIITEKLENNIIVDMADENKNLFVAIIRLNNNEIKRIKLIKY